ncbi:MAG: 3'(2'),5'-bisphosphate nucleotidase CysQ [Nitrospirales bacterium]|nr:3'(2'),5'-bisphosphate nucleotidase CysQ [Nitrospirales bacterium]
MIETLDVQKIVAIAREAGAAIMEIYRRDYSVAYKDDKSPLTEADCAANGIIVSGLQELYPEIPILSEEGKTIPFEERRSWDWFWLVDPLDGTKEFIRKNGEFTVNIALIHRNEPVAGVVYAPALKVCYFARQGQGAYRQEDGAQPVKLSMLNYPLPEENLSLRVVASRSHMSDETRHFIDRAVQETGRRAELVSIGSSLKLCLVAEGTADIYPRLGPTMEWDTAAAHAIVLESGKKVFQYADSGYDGQLQYNKESLLNPWFVVKE